MDLFIIYGTTTVFSRVFTIITKIGNNSAMKKLCSVIAERNINIPAIIGHKYGIISNIASDNANENLCEISIPKRYNIPKHR